MIKKILLIFILSTSLFAGEALTTQLSNNALELYKMLLLLFKNLLWIFAIFPISGIIMSILKDVEKIKEEQGSMMMQQKSLSGDDISKILLNVILVLLAFYIIYGTFGTAYAGSSFSETWSLLVVNFWSEIFK